MSRHWPRGWRREVFPAGVSSVKVAPELIGKERFFREVWRYATDPIFQVFIARAEPLSNEGCSGWLWSATRFGRGEWLAERGLSSSAAAARRRVKRGLLTLQEDLVRCGPCGRLVLKSEAVDVGPAFPDKAALFANFRRPARVARVRGVLEDQTPVCKACFTHGAGWSAH